MMRNDQYIRLQNLTERLTEVVLEEANPDNWPGAGVALADLTKQQRGDRYWSKKNAAATMSLVTKAMSLAWIASRRLANPNALCELDPDGKHDGDLEAEMKDAEKQAEALLAKLAARKTGYAQRAP